MEEYGANKKLLEATMRMKNFRASEKLNIMPKSEFVTMDIILNYEAKGISNINISEISRILEISAPAVSKNIKRIEQKGYVCRIVDGKDRRNTYVAATDKGRDKFKEDCIKMNNFMNKVFSHLSASEIDSLVLLINKICDAIEEENKSL